MIAPVLQYIHNLLGTQFYTTIESATGEIAVIYHVDYITGCILLIAFMVGLFTLISNFQRIMGRRDR